MKCAICGKEIKGDYALVDGKPVCLACYEASASL